MNICFVEVGFQKKVEVMIKIGKRVVRAESVSDESMEAAIDNVIDMLKKQVRRYKSRLIRLSKKNLRFKDESNFVLSNDENSEDEDFNGEIKNIERTKNFAIKPMDPEEAALELDLVGHSFYVFLNSKTNEVNVIYKRRDGSYGLIEPKV